MKTYLVLTAIRGLVRVDGGKKRPIEADQVVALPDAIAEGLLHLGAIEETDADPTVELIWLDDDGAALALAADLRARDRDTLRAAVASLGGELIFPEGHEGLAAGLVAEGLIHSDDRTALVGALRALDGDVIFPGEHLDRFAVQLSNALLVSELAGRVRDGKLPRHELPDVITGATMHTDAAPPPGGESGSSVVKAASPRPKAPAKPKIATK